MDYNQQVKKASREYLIQNAIIALTRNRSKSFIVTRRNFEDITDHFNSLFYDFLGEKNLKFIGLCKIIFTRIKDEWFELYNSTCASKRASSLKVLYLAGPDPINDIEVFLKYGISLSNIWAIEADKKVYDQALRSLKEANIQIKLHKGTLDEFFEQVNHEFDIVYLDACSPIISPNKNPLETLKQIFINKRLTSLSVLITNFSEPKENYNWGNIMGPWFTTRDEEDAPLIDNICGIDHFEKSIYIDNYSKFINHHLDAYYGDFITQFVACFASEIMPFWQALSMTSVQNKYFWQEKELQILMEKVRNTNNESETLEEYLDTVHHHMLSIDAYPLLNWARISKEILNKEHPLIKFFDNKRKKTTLEEALYIGTLLKRFEEDGFGFNTSTAEVCSEEFRELLRRLDFFDKGIRLTTDIPMKNLIIELVFGLYGYPYIANTNKSSAIKYKAKDTWMYSNIFVFDQCRYLYDYIPTIDLLEDFFELPQRQIIIRGCIDCISRNHFDLNRNIFKWGLIEDMYGSKFKKGELKTRINLNELYADTDSTK